MYFYGKVHVKGIVVLFLFKMMLKESLNQSGGEMFLFLLFFSMEDQNLVKKFLIPKCIIFSDINNTKVTVKLIKKFICDSYYPHSNYH